MKPDRLAALLVFFAAFACTAHGAIARDDRMTFQVSRDGSQIGTSTIEIEGSDAQKSIQIATHVEVKFAFFTLYHFDQTETERWANGQLLALSATTNDNGSIRKISASSCSDGLVVQAGGSTRKVVPATVPASLWNAALLTQASALSPQDGTIVPVKVTDKGDDALVVHGRTMHVRHYVVTTTFAQDVWYDMNHRLVQMEMKARDGSTIRYTLI